MTIVVQGYARLATGEIERLAEAMNTQVAATRAEPGCELYAFSRDLAEPDLLVISERWRDQAALDAHFTSPHMAEFNKAFASAKVLDVRVVAYSSDTPPRNLIGG